ncbi:condensation domain-containing protein, partial [Acetobacter persici]|uniref:condensation domain-containing protein n=1 Tax=Acetobacter persici TaxID=1076596 RepID=UPI0036DA0388
MNTRLAHIAQRFISLSDTQKIQFKIQLAKNGIHYADLPIVSNIRDLRVPLSHAQERLWFLWNLLPDDAGYNMTGAVRLKGDLDVGALRNAIEGLSRRHEILRTTFGTDGTQAWQKVHESPLYGWEEAEAQTEDSLIALLSAAAKSPFDLVHGPLLRINLIRTAPDEHVMQFGMHHIISDGWSMEILVREFTEFYTASVEGREAQLAPLPVQYADFALWQREWLDDAALESQLDYWRGQLQGEQPVTTLPLDRPRTEKRSRQAGHVSVSLSEDTTEGLRALSLRHGTTLSTTLLAALYVLLHRYGGDEDIRIGVPVAGRQRAEIEGLVGFFVNTLVVRAELSGQMDVGTLIDQVRERMLEAQTHQDVPFEKLVSALQPERSLSHSPLFQVSYN